MAKERWVSEVQFSPIWEWRLCENPLMKLNDFGAAVITMVDFLGTWVRSVM